MSDKMRWRYGDTNPVVAAVLSDTEIEIGDLLWLDTDNAKPASAQSDHDSEAANQEALAQKFLGVAMQRSRKGESAPIRVATTGVFEMDSPGQTYELGHLVGADGNADNSGLLNQQVVKVAAASMAIGRVAGRSTAETCAVLVDIRSTVMTGGIVSSGTSGS